MPENLTHTINKHGILVFHAEGDTARGREEWHQEAFTRWARLNQSRIPQLELYYHTPNGGRRDKKTAARLVGQGVKKGVPDIFIPAQGKGMPGIYIELKVYGNYADKEQNEFLRAVKGQGYYACICYGWRAAAEVVDRFYTRPNDLIS